MSDSVGNNHPVGGDQLYMNESEMDTPIFYSKTKNILKNIRAQEKRFICSELSLQTEM